jgi:nucleoside-diphosphate-sugar epimerase
MLYMPDAIRGTLELMEAPEDRLKIHTSYNLNGFSFTVEKLAAAIQVRIPALNVTYTPDYRQYIADSWPHSIAGHTVLRDWGWKPAIL